MWVGVAQQQLAGLGQRDGPRAAGPLDQPVADGALQRRDLLRHRALRVAELGRRLRERLRPRDRVEGGQVADLDTRREDQTLRLTCP